MARFFSGTLISRLTGFGRDLTMAWCFGAEPAVAAFMVAFRFSNLLRRLFGEGALNTAFIPLYEKLKSEDPMKARLFFRDLIIFMSLILIFIILFVEIIFMNDPSSVMRLTLWMFPGILFICLYAVNSSLLHCKDAFFVTSAAPALFNLIWIGAVLLLRNRPVDEAMIRLSQVIIIAYLLQWLATLPGVMSEWRGVFFKKSFTDKKEFTFLVKAMGASVIGVGAQQVNTFFDAVFAREANLEGPAWLWYALRLEQLPLALFGIAIANTLLPVLSRAIKKGEGAKTLFELCYNRLLFFLLPVTFGTIVFGFEVVEWLYGRGAFDLQALKQTTYCLYAYIIGLVPTALVALYSTVFFAKGNYHTPMWVSLVAVLLNILLNTFFVMGLGLGAVSIAAATSISAWVNSLVLFKLGQFHVHSFAIPLALMSTVASVVALPLKEHLFLGGGVFVIVYVLNNALTFSRSRASSSFLPNLPYVFARERKRS